MLRLQHDGFRKAVAEPASLARENRRLPQTFHEPPTRQLRMLGNASTSLRRTKTVSEIDTRPAITSNRNRVVFLVISALLIGSFLYRVVVPAHEYAVRSDQLLTMGLDLLAIVCLIGLKRRLRGGSVLYWVALIAGIGLFGIRLLGDDQWWTGHLVYYIEPHRF
jgi:hypothetical protein